MIEIGSTPIGRLGSAWRSCVGSGRANLSLRSDHRAALALARREIGFEYIRGHGLFSDDMAVHRPYDGGMLHNFTYVDQVIDGYLEVGVRPFVELGFMPSELASGEETVFWWKGNITPPADHRAWTDLVTTTLRHLIARYGMDEVRRWPIEVWNEPNLDVFWSADQAAYFHLYDVTAKAIKEVDADLQVGGPAVSPGADDWWEPFADFTAAHGSPVDFVSGHAYTSGPAQHVPFGTYQTLRHPSSLLEQFAAPRRLLGDTHLAGMPVHITEFNTSYRPDNPVHDTAYNAAYLAPTLVRGGDLVDSFSYWTVSDTFEEVGVPTSFFHGGFGLLTHRQVKKPTYHLYAFLARMGDQVLARGDDHLVCRDDAGRLTVLAWQPVGGTEEPEELASHRLTFSIALDTDTGEAFVLRHRVNEQAGNAWSAWAEMGRPRWPSARQLDALHACAEPGREHSRVAVTDGRLRLDLHLERHEVTLLEIDLVTDESPGWLDDSRILGRG